MSLKIMKHKFFTSLFLCVLSVCVTYANGFTPVLTSLKPNDMNIGLQNWSITQNESGEIFIGNNLGILSYDGYNWEKIPLHDNEIARSLLAIGLRIYVGSCNSFGFFERDPYGKWIYTSLSAKLPTKNQLDDYDIWSIHQVDGKIYFQAFNAYFVYDEKETVTAYTSKKNLPLYFHQVGTQIYVQLMNGDFCLLRNHQYISLIPDSYAQIGHVAAVLPLPDNQMLLCTEWKGMFLYDGVTLKPFHTEINEALRREQINRAILIPGEKTILLGTIMNGIYGIDLNGQKRYHFTMGQGMTSNSVMSLFCDQDHNVWAGLDVGLALIHTGTSFASLHPSVGEPSIGMVFGVESNHNDLYIATNQNVWRFNQVSHRLNPIQGTEGQNWYITRFDNQLVAGNNLGPRYIHDDQSTLFHAKIGSTSIKECTIHNQNILLESSYNKLHVYRRIGGSWQLAHIVEGLSAPIRNFEVDNSGIIWASHMNKGLYQIELTKDLKRTNSVKYIAALTPDDHGEIIQVMKIRGRIVFSDRHHIFTYDDIWQKIIPFQALDKIMNKGIISATMIDNDHFWLADMNGYTLVSHQKGEYEQVVSVPSSLFGAECNENSNRVSVDGEYAYFCLNNCVGRYHMHSSNTEKAFLSRLELRQVYSEQADHSPFHLPVYSKDEVQIANGNVTFRFSFPNFNRENVRFVYTLEEGRTTLVTESYEPRIVLSNLNYGSYKLHVKVVGFNGKVLGSTSYAFYNPRPFYLSFAAFFLYFIMIGGVLYLFSRWNTNRLIYKKNKKYEEEKIKQDLKMLEQEKIIARQQQMLLESELSTKSKELASMALDAAAQNSTIENLKEALSKQLQRGNTDKNDARYILKLINSEASDEDFWKIYHQNFDLIHKHFFRNLRSRYPSLTSVDLKFCALLRLNLSTKDIANFTNLTVRGVETARYRLRKKLNISEGRNIVDFLIDMEENQTDSTS